MWRKALLLLALPVLSVAAVAYRQAQSQPVPPVTPIEQPTTWVAFEADVRITQPGEPIIVGRFYRSRDGSTHLETGPEGDGKRVISIRNIQRSLHYSRMGSGKWMSRPMRLPAQGWRPIPVKASPKEVKLVERVADQEVYRNVSEADGTIRLRAPALNMYPVVEQDIRGWRKELSNIRLADPPDELFEPPPGVPVHHVDKPFGVVVGETEIPRQTPSGPTTIRVVLYDRCPSPIAGIPGGSDEEVVAIHVPLVQAEHCCVLDVFLDRRKPRLKKGCHTTPARVRSMGPQG